MAIFDATELQVYSVFSLKSGKRESETKNSLKLFSAECHLRHRIQSHVDAALSQQLGAVNPQQRYIGETLHQIKNWKLTGLN